MPRVVGPKRPPGGRPVSASPSPGRHTAGRDRSTGMWQTMTDGRSTPLSHTARFECDALAIRGARALVGEVLTREGWAPLDVERARLVVSELVANAVVHARSPFTLSYSYDGVLRVGVTDDDPHSDPPPEGRRARSYRRHGPAAGGRDQPRL